MQTSSLPGTRRSFWAAFIVGAGFTAAVDEIIFHQLLAWHHFYDRATPLLGLLSDGFLHAAELIALVGGFFLIADLLRQNLFSRRWAWAGGFVGAGVFQLFDGIVDHKVLRLHQIRYGVESILPYDLAWNGAGLALLLVGVWLLFRAKREDGFSTPPPR